MAGKLKHKNKLRDKLERDILPFVSKPARYIGNEHNSIIKHHSKGMLKIALCFPEMYEIGMPYLGMRILYHLINSRNDCLAERGFMVWPDMEEKLKESGVPLFSIESSTPLKDFHVLGFHFAYEMTYTTAVAMLELSGLSPFSKDRKDSDPIVIAGGPSALNPEPMADFIDAFFIGDAEEAIFEIIDTIKDSKKIGGDKENLLLKLSEISGIYVPRFYKPIYNVNGVFESIEKLKSNFPDKIKVRSVSELKDKYYPSKPIIPYIETSQDHLTIEIMRGCVRGCRFCQAGYQYRPRRQRDVSSIKSEILSSIPESGYDSLTLLSLSSTDYGKLDELLDGICPQLADKKISLSLPSLRPETISSNLLNYLSATRKSGLTLAPEAGTERLRKSAGKDISDDQIFSALETAISAGWQTVKLYFMIGLPGETSDDIEGIAAILRKISYMARQGSGRVNLNVSISPFCPKSHTPWQWEKQSSNEDLEKKIEKLRKRIKKSNIKLSFRNLDLTFIEGAIGRGDRRVGEVIYKAYQNGSRLDGWSEHFEAKRWYDAFSESGIDINSYTGQIDLDAPLPWDHIEKGISKEFLKKENLDSKNEIPPKTAFSKKAAEQETPITDGGFGRRTRRTAKHASAPKGTYRMRVRYSIGRELRFLSHLDNMRTIFRAIRRSEIPVAFSEGFNPHLKVSFGPPLPVGHTSEAEYFDLVLTQPYREEFITNFNNALPEYFQLTGHKYFFAKPGSLVKQLNLAIYEIPFINGIPYDEQRINKLLNEKQLIVQRSRADITKDIEAGKFIENLKLESDKLVAEILQTPDGHIKPDEVLIFGLGIDQNLVKSMTIHRKNQFNKFGGRRIEPLDLV